MLFCFAENFRTPVMLGHTEVCIDIDNAAIDLIVFPYNSLYLFQYDDYPL